MARILIIDDDEQVLQTLAEVVETLGHQVKLARDGRGGLDLFERDHFDCVITDLAMPEVDGLTVLRRVKRKRPETGVLVITGNSSVDLLAASVNMGVDAYVTKPFKIAELDEQLSKILARRFSDTGRINAPPSLARAFHLRVSILWVILAVTAAVIASRVIP